MEYVRRINLKTDCKDRKDLINYCLNNQSEQYVVIGWSCVYEGGQTQYNDYKDFYYAVERYARDNGRRLNHALNSLWYVTENDIFWTRDLEGFYWICRAKGAAEPYCDEQMDIGARVPVEAIRFGLEIPGQIKASFNRANGGIIEDLREPLMINYSKYIFNELSGSGIYVDIEKVEGSFIDNLPDFDLEELVISYLQIKENYYVLSNSIANKSTTVSIECELISRDVNNPKKAVVQVKAKEKIETENYSGFVAQGYEVYFYDGGRSKNQDDGDAYIFISKEMLEEFYKGYKAILPESIKKWEKLFE